MAHLKIDAGDTVYQLVVDGVDGELVEYGYVSLCEVAGTVYMALVPDIDDNGQPTEVTIWTGHEVREAKPDIELVDFGDSEVYDDEDEDEDDGEDDGEDEPATLLDSGENDPPGTR